MTRPERIAELSHRLFMFAIDEFEKLGGEEGEDLSTAFAAALGYSLGVTDVGEEQIATLDRIIDLTRRLASLRVTS